MEQLNNCKHITLTSSDEWDHHSTNFEEQEARQALAMSSTCSFAVAETLALQPRENPIALLPGEDYDKFKQILRINSLKREQFIVINSTCFYPKQMPSCHEDKQCILIHQHN